MDASWKYSVKSLSKCLNAYSPIDKEIYQALWKSKSHKESTYSIWILFFGSLNCSDTLQHNLRDQYLSPSICPLCLANGEDLQHLLINCLFSGKCWWKLFSHFNLQWVFGQSLRDNISQILVGPLLSSKAQILWSESIP